ncbi:MAG: TolC family protein [Gammaproteobacteria bacterium]|nr:TolC family protein [Gammaproteobacteria bacterium]
MSAFFVHAHAWKTRARHWCRGALLLVGLWVPAFAGAAEAELTLRQAIEAALARNPDLAMFEFDFRVNDAQRRQAVLRPPTEAGVSLENFAGTGEMKGFSGLEATLAISQVIELGGKRQARVATVEASRDSLTSARQAAQLDVVAEVTRRFIAVAEAQEKVALALRATELAANTARASDARVQAARAPHVELDRAGVAEQRARLELQSARSQLDTSRRSLAAMWGSDDASVNGLPLGNVLARLYDLPSSGNFAGLVSSLARSPDFLRFASEERLRDTELRLAASQRRADLTVGGGIKRLQASRDYGLVASFSIPLFAGRRSESFIAEAAARRDAVGAEREAALVRAKAQLFALHRQLQDAVAVAQSLEATTIPTMEEALRETEYAFERGRYSYLELVDAQREYLAVQSERIDASTLAQLLAAEIERLTNAPLAP